MTEFALVLPILALLLFGVIQFGVAFNHYITLTDAVRAGARKAAVGRHLPIHPARRSQAVRNAATDLNQSQLNVERRRQSRLGGRRRGHGLGQLPLLDQFARACRQVRTHAQQHHGTRGMTPFTDTGLRTEKELMY